MYRERPSRVPGAVVWRRPGASPGTPLRILPDGCMDLLWVGGELLVTGPDPVAHVTTGTGDPGGYTGVRFAPGTAPAFLGVPADELRGLRVPLADLWPRAEVRRLAGRVHAAPRPGAALEELVLSRLGAGDPPDPAVPGVVAMLRAGTAVADVAHAVGLSERQLRRRCLPAFGYGPKTLMRILRMDRAVALARTGLPHAAVAARTGYADQAHLSREVKTLAGVPLGVLVGGQEGSGANRSTPLPSGSRTSA
ncbi:helix-turn-helix domain-containing protein [Microtetraspora niveoalba]|uniref:helix-turn-helix domain-containing protein n=1 Tax=Microtetraspora niveoalba TaxID=46175 RepID=UPI000830B07E|nr:helix-turn-helix transcriptional regulator [Microtetraspora niveoalba]